MSSLRRRNTQENTIALRNGAVLLEKLIKSCDGKRNPIRSFSAEEIKIATNNFDQQVLVAVDYNLYKGFLQNRPVLVMSWYGSYRCREDDCYNNIIFPIQMRHKNILKLIGCCLDTEFPTLVFESAEEGTLDDRIHCHNGLFEPLRLAHRFKIAMEIANALAYLHFGFRKPIVFRDIKPGNILFDEQNVAKLFNFSLSESIPEGETHIKNGHIAGTYGFLAPEYISTSEINEKCDVYSFGMLLLELLTGKKARWFANYLDEDDDWRFALDDDSLSLDDGSLTPDDDCRIALDDCSIALDEDDACRIALDKDDDCRIEQDKDVDGGIELKYVKKLVENDRLKEIVDPIIIENSACDGKEEQLLAFFRLSLECVTKSPEERPTMMHVAKQLRQMYLFVA